LSSKREIFIRKKKLLEESDVDQKYKSKEGKQILEDLETLVLDLSKQYKKTPKEILKSFNKVSGNLNSLKRVYEHMETHLLWEKFEDRISIPFTKPPKNNTISIPVQICQSLALES